MTSAQKALFALGDHCYDCPTCKPIWQGDTALHQPCSIAELLYQQWRKVFKEGRTA
ncbi:hypothetical protein [Streptomyces cyaneus]|uniref:hypothetical protein n=1 Tax=Streptomyces cyaneus TaxID=1904 RepID=UPI0013E38CA2|nr:hypothetical protein [Streptomyces cyaneus]